MPAVKTEIGRCHAVELQKQHHADEDGLEDAGDAEIATFLNSRNVVQEEVHADACQHREREHPFSQPVHR